MGESHEQRPVHRFSSRVASYVRYRPSYPVSLLGWLHDIIGFDSTWRVADVGSGTGILTRLLLEHGNPVMGVEPNDAMRAAAEEELSDHPRFTSVAGAAEATTLDDHCVDLITVAQAFHWFDADAARREFNRILDSDGHTLIVFNTRRIAASSFMQAYNQFLETHAVDYPRVDHRLVGQERLRAFFGDYVEWRENFSVFHDLDGVAGFSASASYTPTAGHPDHDSFYHALRDLFATYAVDGRVEFLYETEAFLGRPAP